MTQAGTLGVTGWIVCANCGDSNTVTEDTDRRCGNCAETLDFDMGVSLEDE